MEGKPQPITMVVDWSLRYGIERRTPARKSVRGGAAGSGVGSTAKRDLLRYYHLLHQQVPFLAQHFDADLLRQVATAYVVESGHQYLPGILPLAWRNYAAKYPNTAYNAQDVAARLVALTELQELALVDAIERWYIAGVPSADIF